MVEVSGIEVISEAAPSPQGRVNEDTWIFYHHPEPLDLIVAAVIDGVSARVVHDWLKLFLQKQKNGVPPGVFVASVARMSMYQTVIQNPMLPLKQALLSANDALRGELDAAIPKGINGLTKEFYDPREVRLVLPASVVTIARLSKERSKKVLEYAHAGDTILFIVYRDGIVHVPTSDQMGKFDNQALNKAMEIVNDPTSGILHMREAVEREEVKQINLSNGIRHNYIDEHGRTHPGEGCGVIDGLFELADYIETGSIALSNVEFVCLLSDGLIWPTSLEEIELQAEYQVLAGELDRVQSELQQKKLHKRVEEVEKRLHERIEERYQHMVEIIRIGGLRGLLEAIRRLEREDIYFDKYPRLKPHDDATGILIRFQPPE